MKAGYLTAVAYQKLKEGVNLTENRYETGGVLLGYKFLNMFYITAVTVANKKECVSKNSFSLDGKLHSSYATEIRRKYIIKPRILGVWHSHTGNVCVFSCQDIETNKIIANLYDGALSMLLCPKMFECDDWNVYYIDKNYNQKQIKFKIIGK